MTDNTLQLMDSYQRLSRTTQKLEQNTMTANAHDLQSMEEELQAIFKEIQDLEQQLSPEPGEDVLGEKKRLIKQILELQQSIIPALNAKKAAITYELRKLKHGIRTLPAYSSQKKTSGSIVNQAS